MNCSDFENQLVDYESGQLSPLEKNVMEEHLGHCDACAAKRAWLFEFTLMAGRWEDQPVPEWNRLAPMRPTSDRTKQPDEHKVVSLHWHQLLATAASVAALTLVLMQYLLLPGSNTDASSLNETRLDDRMAAFEQRRDKKLAEVVYGLRQYQQESSEIILTSLLDAMRQERRQDMNTLLAAWQQQQEQQANITGKSLSYLLARQRQDERELNTIKAALNTDIHEF